MEPHTYYVPSVFGASGDLGIHGTLIFSGALS